MSDETIDIDQIEMILNASAKYKLDAIRFAHEVEKLRTIIGDMVTVALNMEGRKAKTIIELGRKALSRRG